MSTQTKSTKTNTSVGRGRPAIPVKYIMTKAFTLNELFALNENVEKATVRAHIIRGVKSGKFTKLEETVKTNRRGKPAFRFLNTNILRGRKTSINKTTQTKEVVPVESVEDTVTAVETDTAPF